MKATKKEIRHVIWDWNGTLVNDAPFSWEIFSLLGARRGIAPLSFGQYQAIYGHPVEDMYTKGGFDFSLEPFSDLAEEWHSHYVSGLSQVQLQGGARYVLEQLKLRGITQAVLSALPHQLLLESVKMHKIENFFVEICGLEDLHGRSKIDNAHELMERINADASTTLVVGDSSHDAEVARALGSQCVLVSKGYEDLERLVLNGFPVVHSLEEVLRMIT